MRKSQRHVSAANSSSATSLSTHYSHAHTHTHTQWISAMKGAPRGVVRTPAHARKDCVSLTARRCTFAIRPVAKHTQHSQRREPRIWYGRPTHHGRMPCLTACRVPFLLQSFREHCPGCLLCRAAVPTCCTRPSKAAVWSSANTSGGCRGSSGTSGGGDTPGRTRSTPGASAKGAHSVAAFSPDYRHSWLVASGYDGLGQPR
jgi:hypothetical protein